MNAACVLLGYFVLLILSIISQSTSSEILSHGSPKMKYVVYMGAKSLVDTDLLMSFHIDFLANILGSKEEAHASIIHQYKHSFSGFSAWLTQTQADVISQLPEVVSVFRSKQLQIQTTRSWGFLGMSSMNFSRSWTSSSGRHMVIGVIDTGIWPESESFRDHDMGPVPASWKGKCDNKGVKNVSEIIHCNRKLVGARSYDPDRSGLFVNARDDLGHGTHTASTASGRLIRGENMLGLGAGHARGGLPSSRVAVYKVCYLNGCSDDAILAAFDDAIHDGVDIISLSVGGTPVKYDQDSIAIGSFHAVSSGILVSCAGGNSGPDLASVSNSAPWILTAAASTLDRSFSVEIELGNGKILRGTALSQKTSRNSKIIWGGAAARNSADTVQAGLCSLKALDAKKVKGNIIVCTYDATVNSRAAISSMLSVMKARGLILGDNFFADLMSYFPLPGGVVKKAVLHDILSYINSTRNATATISATKTLIGTRGTSPAPAIAGFSSRGPNSISPDILKPDISAPGVNIIASWSPVSPIYENGKESVFGNFNIISGTSMACPHVTGAAAFVKSFHSDWSAAAVKSALMTTAKHLDNANGSIKDYDGKEATPFATGAGEINPLDAVNPGLVYDIVPHDFVDYLCASGYTSQKLKLISGQKNITCSGKSGPVYLNYPTITVPKMDQKTTVKRTVTNVGAASASYKVTIVSPTDIKVKVTPAQLQFTKFGQKLSFDVEFKVNSRPIKSWQFGSITWVSGSTSVRSTFAVSDGGA